jgi:uncharacterized membrane protein YqjE
MNHDVTATGATQPLAGITTALRRLLAAAIAHIAARGELFALEFAEEKERLFIAAVAVFVSVAAAFFALGLACVGIVLYAWDTAYRWPVVIALPVLFVALSAGGWWAFRATMSRPSPLFRTSLMELRRDVGSIHG